MGESTKSSSFYNPTLSANKHVQICRFWLSAAADLADGPRERRTSSFNGHAQSWNCIERSLSRAIVCWFARLRHHGSNSVVFVHQAGALAKEYPLSKLFSKAELLPFEQEKYINLVCFSCLKHANEMLLGDPRQPDQRTQSFNFSNTIHQSLDPTAQAPRSILVFTCLHESVFYIPLSCTNGRTRAIEYCFTQSLSPAQNATRRRAVEVIIIHDHSRFQLVIDRRHKRLSLSTTHEKSLTHNIPGASASGIIGLFSFFRLRLFIIRGVNSVNDVILSRSVTHKALLTKQSCAVFKILVYLQTSYLFKKKKKRKKRTGNNAEKDDFGKKRKRFFRR